MYPSHVLWYLIGFTGGTMTALYGVNSINLPHVDLYKWAADKKIFLPPEYFVKEIFQRNVGELSSMVCNPYTYEDLFAFIEALRKEFQPQL